MINKKIYNKLKEIASREETISYSQLARDCDMPYTSVDERNQFHHLIGDISIFEIKHNRPMLSVLVHYKGDIFRKSGQGFFELADELNQRKEGEDDMKMQYRIIKEVWNCWKK